MSISLSNKKLTGSSFGNATHLDVESLRSTHLLSGSQRRGKIGAKNPREPHEGNENPFEIDIQGHILRLGTWKPKKNTPKTPNLRSNHGPSLPNTVDGSEIRLASWLVVNPKKTNKVLSIPGGAGFLPSTVPLEKVFSGCFRFILVGPNIFSGDVWMSRELPCRERETISHQTGASENHRLKKVPGW